MRIKRGELVRVDLFVSLPTPRHFVVVDDPVPGGLEPVNRDFQALARRCRRRRIHRRGRLLVVSIG